MDAREASGSSLNWPDYLVVAVVMSISASIGVYFRFTGGRQKTATEYFSANRSLNVVLLGIAVMVAYVSAISLLGISGEAYIYGSGVFLLNIGYVLGCCITVVFYLPVFYKLQMLSIYEYLEKRFGPTARRIASAANSCQLVFYTGVVLYAPALALEATTGLSSLMSILVIGIICTFYSTLGGMKAVLATDVFQGALMYISLLCIICVVCHDVEGGVSEVWRRAVEDHRFDIWEFSPDPTLRHSFWAMSIGGIFFFVSHFGVSQIAMQRLSAAKSLRSAKIALCLAMPLVATMFCVTELAGIAVFSWFRGCDPVASGRLHSFDQVLPYFALIRLSKIPGLAGVFIAGVFSASLSTISAMINSLAAVAISDYVKPLYKRFGKELSETRASWLGKIFGVCNGLSLLGVSYMASKMGGILRLALSISGALGGPIAGLFSLGLFVEAADEKGAVAGFLASLSFMLYIPFGHSGFPASQLVVSIKDCPNATIIDSSAYEARRSATVSPEDARRYWLHRISYMWYPFIGTSTTILFGYIASVALRCFGKGSTVKPDPDLFTPFIAARIRKRREFALQANSSLVLGPK